MIWKRSNNKCFNSHSDQIAGADLTVHESLRRHRTAPIPGSRKLSHLRSYYYYYYHYYERKCETSFGSRDQRGAVRCGGAVAVNLSWSVSNLYSSVSVLCMELCAVPKQRTDLFICHGDPLHQPWARERERERERERNRGGWKRGIWQTALF